AILEAMIADERQACLVQRAHFAAELLVGERSAVLSEQPGEGAFTRTLRRKLRQAACAPGIEQRQEHALDALYGDTITGAPCSAVDRAGATVIALPRLECPQLGGVKSPAGERLAARIIGQRQHRASPPLARHTSSPMFSFPGRAGEAIS